MTTQAKAPAAGATAAASPIQVRHPGRQPPRPARRPRCSAPGASNGGRLSSSSRLPRRTTSWPCSPWSLRAPGGSSCSAPMRPRRLPANLAALRQAAPGGVPPLVMTDEEGGEVQRMANLVGNLPWPRTMTATMTEDQVRALAEQVGLRMHAAGVTMTWRRCSTCRTVRALTPPTRTGRARSASRRPIATAYGLAFAQGLLEAGVIPVVKHFPGLGQASYNTDFGPASVPPLSVLEAGSLRPFEAAIRAGAPAVMVGERDHPGPYRHTPRIPFRGGRDRPAAAPARFRWPRPDRLAVGSGRPGCRRHGAAGRGTRDRGRRRHGAIR